MQDPIFDKYNSYQTIKMIENIKQIFFFDLKPITNNTNNLFIKKAKLLPVFLFVLSIILFVIKNNKKSLFFTLLDNNASFIRCLIKIYHITNRYNIVAQYMVFLAIVQNKICKLFSYNKAICLQKQI